jgi:ABC-type multidrug transport system fused ATPase/permease subunit
MIIKSAARYWAEVSVAKLVMNVTHNLRQLVFDRCLGYGKLFFDRSSLGHLSQVLMNYTAQVTNPIPHAHQIISMVFSLGVYLTLMALISWPLTLFVILVFPLMNLVLAGIIKRVKHYSERQTDSLNDLSKRVFNILSSIPLVKLYDQEKAEQRRFADISRHVATLDYALIKAHNLSAPLQEGMALLTMLLVVGAMSWLTRRGQVVAPASFIVFFYLVLHTVTTYGRLHRFQGALARAAGPMEEIKKILSDTDKHVVPDGTQIFSGFSTALTFNDLHFSYDAAMPVLRGVSFIIPAQQVTALVGPTGSGKTTIVSLLLRFYDCPPNSIFFDGEDIQDFTASSVREHMAFVSQDAWLFNDTLWANLTYGLPAVTEEEAISALERARLFELVQRLPKGLQTEIGDRGVQLSGGEKQRLSIARALLKKAEIVIFDEPTSALDAQTEQLVQAALADAMQGKTVLVIAHRLATIQHADSIIVLEAGRVIEQGTWHELYGRHEGLFRTFWDAQSIRA